MAINETIVTGRKFRKLIDEATKLWQRISFWGVATDVEFDDGENAETKFGAISGITDSLTSTSSNVAASAAAVKALNDKIVELNSDLMEELILSGSAWSGDSNGQHNDGRFSIAIPNGWKTVSGCSYTTYANNSSTDGTQKTISIASDKTGNIGTFSYKSFASWTLHLARV